MASQRFEKGSMEFEWFADFWKITQDHWMPEDSDDYWTSLVNDADGMMQKYRNDEKLLRFTEKIIGCGLLQFLEEEHLNDR